MPVDGKAGLQDLFLAAAARDQERMTLFLVNGVMLQGGVTGFDQFSLPVPFDSGDADNFARAQIERNVINPLGITAPGD